MNNQWKTEAPSKNLRKTNNQRNSLLDIRCSPLECFGFIRDFTRSTFAGNSCINETRQNLCGGRCCRRNVAAARRGCLGPHRACFQGAFVEFAIGLCGYFLGHLLRRPCSEKAEHLHYPRLTSLLQSFQCSTSCIHLSYCVSVVVHLLLLCLFLSLLVDSTTKHMKLFSYCDS